MNIPEQYSNEKIASEVVSLMTNEYVLSSIKMTTGDQNFVFAVKIPSQNTSFCYMHISRLHQLTMMHHKIERYNRNKNKDQHNDANVLKCSLVEITNNL